LSLLPQGALNDVDMIWINNGKPASGNSSTIGRILETGEVSRQDYQTLMTSLLSDRNLTEGDRRRINQIFDALHSGKIRLV